MKKTIIFGLFILIGLVSQAQTFDEWFRQKKTQQKYLMEQILALKVYKDFVTSGYQVVSGGLNLIGDIKDGEFGLHKNYFNSLKSVNPQVRKYGKVGEIISLQVKVFQSCQSALKALKQSGMMKEEDLLYLKRVFDRAIENGLNLLDELTFVITDDQISLKDNERIEQIDRIHEQSFEIYHFVQNFANEAKQFSLLKLKDKQEAMRMKKYYGIEE